MRWVKPRWFSLAHALLGLRAASPQRWADHSFRLDHSRTAPRRTDLPAHLFVGNRKPNPHQDETANDDEKLEPPKQAPLGWREKRHPPQGDQAKGDNQKADNKCQVNAPREVGK